MRTRPVKIASAVGGNDSNLQKLQPYTDSMHLGIINLISSQRLLIPMLVDGGGCILMERIDKFTEMVSFLQTPEMRNVPWKFP